MSSNKKSHTFSISHVINAPAKKVWAVIGEQYGEIEKYHPDITESKYNEGFTIGGEGSERVSYLNENKTKIAYEKQLNFDPENFSFTSQVIKFEGASMNPEGTFMKYKIEPINATSCRLLGEMGFQLKPAFLGWIFKNVLKNASQNHFMAIEHYVMANEPINK